GLRRIELFRDGKRLLFAKVAVGAPGRETPLGEFYVTARFVPDDPFLGAFALETSAYSRLTEWPGGGKVGIHGTSKPWLLGQAVSHGCVRVSNQTALALKRLAPVGTPISIVARSFALIVLNGAGEKVRRAQALDPVTVVLKGVVAAQPLPAAAGTRGDAHRSEAIAEPVADERSCSPGLCRGERAPGAVAAREVHGYTNRPVVYDDAPPAPPV